MKEKQQPLSIEDSYFKGLIECSYDNLYVDSIRELTLLDKDERLLIFNNLVDQLSIYRVNKRKVTDRVKKAWEVIDNFFLDKTPELVREEITPLVFGSIIFDDARNLDYDLLLFSDSKKDNYVKMITAWDIELDSKWNKISNGGGHISYLSLNTLKIFCNFLNSNLNEYVQYNAESIDTFYLMNVSILFTGVLVNEYDENFIEINRQLPQLQEKALNIANQSPILMATIIRNLQDTKVIRDLRRNGFK